MDEMTVSQAISIRRAFEMPTARANRPSGNELNTGSNNVVVAGVLRCEYGHVVKLPEIVFPSDVTKPILCKTCAFGLVEEIR